VLKAWSLCKLKDPLEPNQAINSSAMINYYGRFFFHKIHKLMIIPAMNPILEKGHNLVLHCLEIPAFPHSNGISIN
jgi:hypothetical protein